MYNQYEEAVWWDNGWEHELYGDFSKKITPVMVQRRLEGGH